MKRLVATTLLMAVVVFSSGVPLVQAATGANDTEGRTRVLKGIPAIARSFAPVANVDWKDFAKTLAGICAVESTCSPTYPHWVKTRSGNRVYSQYQGLFQMNTKEVAKAEAALAQMLPTMRAAAQSDPEQQKALAFVEEAIQKAKAGGGDLRFHPEYGIILGAAKHIQIHKQLEDQYKGQPIWQAAGHMTAQFSGITEGKIRNRQFNAPITGNPNGNPHTEEAAALAANKVHGRTVHDAISSAGAVFGRKMEAMMNQLNQVTNGLTGVPTQVDPFSAPAVNPGTSPILDIPYNGVSTLMETGYLTPQGVPTSGAGTSLPGAPTGGAQQPGAPTSGSTLDKLKSGISNLVYGTPALNLIAEQQGDKIKLIWAASGVKEKSCVVRDANNNIIAQGEKGEQTYSVQADIEGAIEFVLECTDGSGKKVQDKALVTVGSFTGLSLGGAFSDSTPGTTATSTSSLTGATFDELFAQAIAEREERAAKADPSAPEFDPNATVVRLVPTQESFESQQIGNGSVNTLSPGQPQTGSNTTFGDPTFENTAAFNSADNSAFLTVAADMLNNIQTALNQLARIILGR